MDNFVLNHSRTLLFRAFPSILKESLGISALVWTNTNVSLMELELVCSIPICQFDDGTTGWTSAVRPTVRGSGRHYVTVVTTIRHWPEGDAPAHTRRHHRSYAPLADRGRCAPTYAARLRWTVKRVCHRTNGLPQKETEEDKNRTRKDPDSSSSMTIDAVHEMRVCPFFPTCCVTDLWDHCVHGRYFCRLKSHAIVGRT